MNETTYAVSGMAGDVVAETAAPATQATGGDDSSPTRAEVMQMIDERLGALRVYVLESDITAAQQAVKSVVELSSF